MSHQSAAGAVRRRLARDSLDGHQRFLVVADGLHGRQDVEDGLRPVAPVGEQAEIGQRLLGRPRLALELGELVACEDARESTDTGRSGKGRNGGHSLNSMSSLP